MRATPLLSSPLRPLIKSERTWRLLIVGVVVLALLLRVWAALMLPIDADEPTYLEVGYDYATALRAGDLGAIVDYPENREHPALVKLLYGVTWLVAGEEARWMEAVYTARALSVLFGTLSVLLVALVDPLAGLFLAVHTMEVKYTSEVYLEALPQFAAIAAVLALARAKSVRRPWFWLSAVALGMTAAGKYTYVPLVLPLVYLAFKKKPGWRALLGYLLVAALSFWLLNPTLWRAPVQRLADSLFFHADYAQSAHVQSYDHPWYQPVVWVLNSVPWHPQVFFYIGLDSFILLAALPGSYLAWLKEKGWAVVWMAGSLLFLFIWPTKWPQYTLIFIPALCFLASETFVWFYTWFRDAEGLREWIRMMGVRPPKIALVLLAAFLLYVVGGSIINGARLRIERLNWWDVLTYTSDLPGNTVHDLQPLPGGRIAVATETGGALWTPPQTGEQEGTWERFTPSNSTLPDDRVLSVAWDGAGGVLWFGTDEGLARYEEGEWTLLPQGPGTSGPIWDLEVDGEGGLWAATSRGLLYFADETWTTFTSANSGLEGELVFTLAIPPGEEVVYVGTDVGVSAYDRGREAWSALLPRDQEIGSGVGALLIDAAGHLWVGTLGRGLGRWDGEAWDWFRAGGPALPFNTVTALFEREPGILWVGTSQAASAGGAVSTFDGEAWQTFEPQNSGYWGAEPLVIVGVPELIGRGDAVLIGTRAFGIAVYQPR